MIDKLKAKFREAVLHCTPNLEYIKRSQIVENIDRLLDTAKVVYGDPDDYYSVEKHKQDTHASLVLFNELLVEKKAEGTEPYYCAKCGKDMESSVIHPPHEGTRVFWHKDGTPDNCKTAEPPAEKPVKDAGDWFNALEERVAALEAQASKRKINPSTLEGVRRAVKFYEGKWPENLSSGVMFFDGARITIEEFNEQARLFSVAEADQRVTVEEICERLERNAICYGSFDKGMADRIRKHGIRGDK